MNDPLKLAVVGVRNIGKGHVKLCQSLGHARVVALADTDPERLQAVADEFGIPEAFADAGELFEKCDVDGVVLAVPNHLHAPLAIQAMEQGKHVLVEKPIARNTLEAEEMIAARDRCQRVLMVGMSQRFNPQIHSAKRLIEQGVLGGVYYAKTRYVRRRIPEGLWGRGDWFLSHDLSGGGPLIDLGVHNIDLMLHLMGFPEIRSVDGVCFHGQGRAEAGRRGKAYEIEDFAGGMIRLAGNRALYVETSFFLSIPEPEARDDRLHGTKGCLTLNRGKAAAFLTDGEAVEELALPSVPGAATSAVQHFANVLTGREELSPTAEQGLEIMRIIEALYESASTGQAVCFL